MVFWRHQGSMVDLPLADFLPLGSFFVAFLERSKNQWWSQNPPFEHPGGPNVSKRRSRRGSRNVIENEGPNGAQKRWILRGWNLKKRALVYTGCVLCLDRMFAIWSEKGTKKGAKIVTKMEPKAPLGRSWAGLMRFRRAFGVGVFLMHFLLFGGGRKRRRARAFWSPAGFRLVILGGVGRRGGAQGR